MLEISFMHSTFLPFPPFSSRTSRSEISGNDQLLTINMLHGQRGMPPTRMRTVALVRKEHEVGGMRSQNLLEQQINQRARTVAGEHVRERDEKIKIEK
jgi:hypothetical protein